MWNDDTKHHPNVMDPWQHIGETTLIHNALPDHTLLCYLSLLSPLLLLSQCAPSQKSTSIQSALRAVIARPPFMRHMMAINIQSCLRAINDKQEIPVSEETKAAVRGLVPGRPGLDQG